MNAGEALLADVPLEALERHIQEALAGQDLAPLAREKFGDRLREVRARRAQIRSTLSADLSLFPR